jgi:peptidoglycan biosynthesis protein MviN/MurJ (putative lipid II flippase)
LTKIIFPYLFFISLAAIVQATLNSYKLFGPSAFTPVLLNLTIVGVVVLFAKGMSHPSYAFAIAFSVGGLFQLAFQIRYRYEIMPLAYLYAVYTRGGKIYEADEEDDLGTLYKRPWEDPSKDNFTVKVRYRF